MPLEYVKYHGWMEVPESQSQAGGHVCGTEHLSVFPSAEGDSESASIVGARGETPAPDCADGRTQPGALAPSPESLSSLEAVGGPSGAALQTEPVFLSSSTTSPAGLPFVSRCMCHEGPCRIHVGLTADEAAQIFCRKYGVPGDIARARGA